MLSHLFILLALPSVSKGLWTAEYKLWLHLMNNCTITSGVRPVLDPKETLQVDLQLVVYRFVKVLESESTVIVVSETQRLYNNPCTRWDNADNPYWKDIPLLSRARDEGMYRPPMWLPNTAETSATVDSAAANDPTFMFYPNGDILISLLRTYSFICEIDYRKFPFDRSVI